MTTSFQGTAKIYRFPARGRFADSNRGTVPKVSKLDTAPRIAPVASGDGWYHEEAVRDADLNRKN